MNTEMLQAHRGSDLEDQVYRFGERLITTGDLDPVYIGLVGLDLDDIRLSRWLLSYFCFYHSGVACYMSEKQGVNYWVEMLYAAHNQHEAPPGGRWPRSSERRHYRGQNCVDSVAWLRKNAALEQLRLLTSFDEPVNALKVMDMVQQWPMFGPWIAFKAADMLERCAGVRVEFPDSVPLLYEAPRAGLEILANHYGVPAEAVHKSLAKRFAALPAPPRLDRPCGPQELETVLCKWKSSLSGHYHVGKDITEVRHGLAGWGTTAERMLAAMPAEVKP